MTHRCLLRSTKSPSADGIFHNLLANANREFAKLLRDVRKAQTEERLGADGGGSGELLMRALRCATKQYILQKELRNLALKDELTSLHNHRGFYAFAERQLKVCARSGRGVLLFFIDMDGLKQINDSLGHGEGDRALKRTAAALKETFRDSDIVARLGGDEFAVLAIEASGHGETAILRRLQRCVSDANKRGDISSHISLSVGVARFDPRRPALVEELVTQADQAMYLQKWARRNSSANCEGYKAPGRTETYSPPAEP